MKRQDGDEEYIDVYQVAAYTAYRDNSVMITFKNGDTVLYQNAGRWKSIMRHLR